MLWRKAWLETRWRFLIGLALLALSAASAVFTYPRVVELLSSMPNLGDTGGLIGRQIRESAELARTYRGYVWSQWFLQNLPQLWTIFAVLLGTGGLFSSAWGGGTLFTLSLPISRARMIRVRAATGLAELLALALLPSLLVPLYSLAIGAHYSVADALIHGLCVFVAGSVFFSLAFWLSTVFGDVWRPILIAICLAVGLGALGQLVPELSRFNVFRLMSAEGWFRGHGLPWLGLLASALTSAALLAAAERTIARRDF